ncbi:uncharacterized protein SAPINGB_P004728 [Magnusiomyces paraingens]|uniref:Cytochrome c oxidase assembly factor 3 n=1 Tax=Magnusiomyces paraingens TaxID=2606893 RepID=A0A5E8C1Z1_9ASCO|nr:uncharacterized protein SAPINGB_P004728 [Saprochaete ingens]VVT55767.1 unnamed protein product [Saprochaete ingens]
MSAPNENGYKPLLRTSKYQNPVNYTMTPAALRARKPYFWKNTIASIVLFGVVGGIYFYSLNALVQDDFGDIPVPPISDDKLAELRRKRDEEKKADH